MKSKTAVIAFDALSHDGRLKIFRKLVKRGKSGIGAGELCEVMKIPPATLSFHMSKLVNGDLVKVRKKGKYVYYSANFKQIAGLVDYLLEKCGIESTEKDGKNVSKADKQAMSDPSSSPLGNEENLDLIL